MKFNASVKFLISNITCFFAFLVVLSGQTLSFRNFGAESDIPNGFIYTINQSDDGYLWIGTGNGISRFDGFDFYNVSYPDSTDGRYPTASLKDKNGILWFGCSDGSVFFTDENKLIPVPISNSKSISDILEGPDGFIYIIPQGKAVFAINSIDREDIHQYDISDDLAMFSASFTSSGNLLIGSQGNILECRIDKDSLSVVSVIDGFDYSDVTAIQRLDDNFRFIIGTAGNGLFKLRMSGKDNLLTRFENHKELDSLTVQSIYPDRDKDYWISTFGSGLIQLILSDDNETLSAAYTYNTSSGMTADDVKSVFQDIEGNYWIGFFGEGFSMLSSYAFRYYKPGRNSAENNILYVNSLNDKYILGTPNGFHLFDAVAGKSVSYTNLFSQVGKTEITSYYLDKDKDLWIGTLGKGLFLRKSSGSVGLFYRSGDSGQDDIKDIAVDGQNIWLATTNGVIVLDKISGKVKQRFDLSNGLPHNSINSILITRDKKACIGTESDRLFMIDSDFNISSGNASMVGSTINKVLSLSQNTDGVVWAATKGNGIFRATIDSLTGINRSDDLMSNYCYSILADSEGTIWTGHEKGISQYNPQAGTMRSYGTDYVEGGTCNQDGMFESADRKIFFGTTEGLLVYDRLKENKKVVAPFNNINYILINDIQYPYQPSFNLPYSRKYTIRVSYVGINFNSGDKVFYSTYLQNYDDDWNRLTTSREVSYNLSDGKYKFNLLSVNDEGLSQSTPLSFLITIKKPIYKTWWFILSVAVIIAGIIILIFREREKAQKRIQEYLEKELEARTSVVMKQKGEIELQNIEITDSINYAKRIQSSILPDITRLKDTFKDAFILFHPRDIVSGDFYWFDKLGDDKFVLVCADSTGHGVPGAFMSMIGSTLLQDIVTRQKISKPSEILTLLDKRIFSTLNQNVELGISNDGMDMVVCEFSMKTRHIRFASAMRPVILVLGGESYYIKGNRASVGGESAIEKYFDDQEYYLAEGDTIYMFSDGLPDQFGGTDGKKLKIARLKRLIEKVSGLAMDEQKTAISEFFFEWKGDFEQVDDILLMGVKV